MQPISGSGTILTWKWVRDNEHVLVCVNFGSGTSGGYVVCSDAPSPHSGSTIPVLDMIGGVTYDRNPDEMKSKGLFILLDGYQTQVMRY
jgi:hypothetical protein